MKKNKGLALFAPILWVASCAQPVASPPPDPIRVTDDVLAQFEGELEALREQLRIPGLSAAISG
jgi:hypothetical protein